MSDFRRVTDDFTTAPQISVADVAEAARQGFKTVINNRPDGEDPAQPSAAQIEAAAKAAGLAYFHIPVRGGPTPDQVEQTKAILAEAETPVLAFCRSGTRSIVTWSLSQAEIGERTPAELVGLGRAAGYDLSGVLGG
ncbi:MAG TPA: TIGR01244 family sulfur transferase [Phenylobacterium sp.]